MCSVLCGRVSVPNGLLLGGVPGLAAPPGPELSIAVPPSAQQHSFLGLRDAQVPSPALNTSLSRAWCHSFHSHKVRAVRDKLPCAVSVREWAPWFGQVSGPVRKGGGGTLSGETEHLPAPHSRCGF